MCDKEAQIEIPSCVTPPSQLILPFCLLLFTNPNTANLPCLVSVYQDRGFKVVIGIPDKNRAFAQLIGPRRIVKRPKNKASFPSALKRFADKAKQEAKVQASKRVQTRARVEADIALASLNEAKKSTQAATIEATNLTHRALAAAVDGTKMKSVANDKRSTAALARAKRVEANRRLAMLATSMFDAKMKAEKASARNEAEIAALLEACHKLETEDAPATQQAEAKSRELIKQAAEQRLFLADNIESVLTVEPHPEEYLSRSILRPNLLEAAVDAVAGIGPTDIPSVRLAGRDTAEAMERATASALKDSKTRVQPDERTHLFWWQVDLARLAMCEKRAVVGATVLEAFRQRELSTQNACTAHFDAANQAAAAYYEALAAFKTHEKEHLVAKEEAAAVLADEIHADQAVIVAEDEFKTASSCSSELQVQVENAVKAQVVFKSITHQAEALWTAAKLAVVSPKQAYDVQPLCL